MILDELLKSRGLDYDALTPAEKETYEKWLEALNTRPITAEETLTYIKRMRESVSLELADTEEFVYVLFLKVVNRKHVALKARLKNYLLLEAFMESKERARSSFERQIKNLMEKGVDA